MVRMCSCICAFGLMPVCMHTVRLGGAWKSSATLACESRLRSSFEGVREDVCDGEVDKEGTDRDVCMDASDAEVWEEVTRDEAGGTGVGTMIGTLEAERGASEMEVGALEMDAGAVAEEASVWSVAGAFGTDASEGYDP